MSICSPVGVVCWSLHFVKNSMWWFVFVRIIFFWCNLRCVVLVYYGNEGLRVPSGKCGRSIILHAGWK